MNERIDEFIGYAKFKAEETTKRQISLNTELRTFSKFFAELIVRECMRMCDVAAVGYETHGHNNIASGCDSAKEYIAEHFGVEL